MNEHKDERQGVSTDPVQCAHNVQANRSADSEGASLREQDIRQFLNQLTISVSAAAELLGVPESQVRGLARRTDFLVLDHSGHEAVNILRLINWVERQAVTARKEGD